MVSTKQLNSYLGLEGEVVVGCMSKDFNSGGSWCWKMPKLLLERARGKKTRVSLLSLVKDLQHWTIC